MANAIEVVEGEHNGVCLGFRVDVWVEFCRFGWGIVEVVSALVGGLADVLDWIRGGRCPVGVPLHPKVHFEEGARLDPRFVQRVVKDVQWQRQPPSIVDVPYNCLMGRGGPRQWYAIAARMHTRVYFTHYEADKLVISISANSRKKFNHLRDAEHWLQHQFQINRNAQPNTLHM